MNVLMAIICLIVFIFAFQFIIESTIGANKWDDFFYQLKGKRLYIFPDDSICPCNSNMMIFSDECNKKVHELLKEYDRIGFCEESR
jgi:hypothetical protein